MDKNNQTMVRDDIVALMQNLLHADGVKTKLVVQVGTDEWTIQRQEKLSRREQWERNNR